MHAFFYCRLLHLHHAHDDGASAEASTPGPTPPSGLAPRMRPATPATPSQRLRPRGGGDRDHQPSLHTLVVPRLIEAGYTLNQISDLTCMPRALVELIADEHPQLPATIDTAQSIRDFLQPKLREAELARRRRTRTAAAIVIAATLSIAASIASVIWRLPALGAAATAGSMLLVFAVFVLARRSRPETTDRPEPPR